MPSSARCRSPINHRPAAGKREAAQCDDHPDDHRTIRHGTAVSTSQKMIACPKARQNRSRHRYADPRTATLHVCAKLRPKRFFSLDRALRSRWRLCRLRMRRTPCGYGPFLFWQGQKRNGGCICPAISMAVSPRPMGRLSKKGQGGQAPFSRNLLTASPAPAAPAPCRAGPTG